MKLKKQFRTLTASDMNIDAESRTVEISFSSELPVERYFGTEILSHDQGAYDFSRIEQGACPLLFNHDPDELIGTVEKAWVDNKVAYAKVKFSKSECGEEKFQQLQEGVLKNISFGYMIKKLDQMPDVEGQPMTFVARDWQVFEISCVSVPADPTVGYGRADTDFEFDVEINKIGEQKRENLEMDKETVVPQVDVAALKNDAIAQERARVSAISAMAEKHGLKDLARQLIDSGKSLSEAREAFLDKMGMQVKAIDQTANDLPLSEKEKGSYSMVRAINAAISGDWSKAGFERECSAEIAKRAQKETQGFFMPMNISNRAAYITTTAAAAGNLVATNLDAGSFIELLRNKIVVKQLGAKMLSGLVGNLAVPRQGAASVAYWVTEGSSVTEDESMTFDLMSLTPKTIGARSQITRQMLQQSTPDIEMLVRDDFANVLALGIDLAALNGSGSSGQPRGIINQSGIGSVVGGTNGATITIDHMIDLETAVATANAAEGTLNYVANAKTVGKLKKSVSSTGQYLWTNAPAGGRSATPGEINGYNVARTNQLPSNLTKGSSSGVCSAVVFGNFSDLVIGEWGVLEILPNPYGAGFNAGSVDIRALQTVDVNVRRAASFAAMTDALTV